MRILKQEAIGVVIDIQERLFLHIHEHEQLTHNCQILIQGLQALQVPLLVTQQYTKGLGETIEPLKTLLAQNECIEKSAFSCCDDEGFSNQLDATGKKNVILLGIETHVCLLQTVLDLKAKGFQPIVVEDCVSSRKAADKATAIERMRQEGAIITSYESILFELARYSGTPEFKQISKLVK